MEDLCRATDDKVVDVCTNCEGEVVKILKFVNIKKALTPAKFTLSNPPNSTKYEQYACEEH